MIGRKAAMGGGLMVGARLMTRLVDLLAMLVLARVLLPTDFGVVAIAMGLVSVVEAILDLPMNQALLRLPTITRAHYDTAFTVGLLRGLLLSVLLVLGAWPFAKLYGDMRLVPLVCVLSMASAARGLVSPRLAEYQKSMSFWRDFVIELAGKLVGFGMSVGVALATHSYWAIAAGAVSYPLACALWSYQLAPYRPRLALSELKVFTGFVGSMSAAQVIGALNWQSERLLLGKLKTLSQVGLFSTASDVANIPFMALFGPVMRPLLAAFAHLQNEPERLARSYQNASNAMVALGLPILVGISLVAEPVVRLMLGPKWMSAVPLVHWLALSLTPALFTLPTVPLLMCAGKTNVFMARNTLELCVKLPLAIGGAILYGFAGIIVARFVAELAADLFCIVVVRQLTGLSMRAQIFGSWRSALATGAMTIAVLICLHFVEPGNDLWHAGIALAAAASIGTAAYALAAWSLWIITGRPQGVEAMVIDTLSTTLRRIVPKRTRMEIR